MYTTSFNSVWVLNKTEIPTFIFVHLLRSVFHTILCWKKKVSFPHVSGRPDGLMVSSNCYKLSIDLYIFYLSRKVLFVSSSMKIFRLSTWKNLCVNATKCSFVWYTVHGFFSCTCRVNCFPSKLKSFPCLVYKDRCQTNVIDIW